MCFIDSSAEEVTGNRERERVCDTQQRDLGRESKPGSAAARTEPLYMGR